MFRKRIDAPTAELSEMMVPCLFESDGVGSGDGSGILTRFDPWYDFDGVAIGACQGELSDGCGDIMRDRSAR